MSEPFKLSTLLNRLIRMKNFWWARKSYWFQFVINSIQKDIIARKPLKSFYCTLELPLKQFQELYLSRSRDLIPWDHHCWFNWQHSPGAANASNLLTWNRVHTKVLEVLNG